MIVRIREGYVFRGGFFIVVKDFVFLLLGVSFADNAEALVLHHAHEVPADIADGFPELGLVEQGSEAILHNIGGVVFVAHESVSDRKHGGGILLICLIESFQVALLQLLYEFLILHSSRILK